MKWVLWLLGLFAIAVVGAFIAGHNEGTVTVFWPPYRLDMSINLVALLLVIGFFFAHGVLRAMHGLLDLPRQARRWRLLQKERAVHAALLDALALMLTGRYLRARKAAQQALELELDLRNNLRLGESLPKHLASLRVMADLVAAESAHALRDRPSRDHHLSQALAADPQGNHPHMTEFMDAAQLSSARWTLGDRDAHDALRQLAQLPHGLARRTLALRLRLKASRLVRNHGLALETARLLAKHGAFTGHASESLLRSLALSSLQDCVETEQVSRLWGSLTADEASDHNIARAAARRWLSLGGEPGRAMQWLMPQWQTWAQSPDSLTPHDRHALVDLMEQVFNAMAPDADWLQRLERATQQWPQQSELHYLSACVYTRHALWGKAQQALDRCTNRLSHPEISRRAWTRSAELAEQRGDLAQAAQCWKKAAQT